MNRERVLLYLYPPSGRQECPRYAYAGGNRNYGNIHTHHGQGTTLVSVTLIEPDSPLGQPRRYRIVGVDFAGPGKSQFQLQPLTKPNSAVIENQATGAAEVTYTVRVQDKHSGDEFGCCPIIKNIPPGGF